MSDDGNFVDSLNSSLGTISADLTIRHVRDTGSARAELLASSDDIRCVVLTAPVPGDDGLSFVRSVRESDSTLPIVVAADDQEFVRDSVNAGATDYCIRELDGEAFSWLAFRVQKAIEDSYVEQSNRARLEQQRVVSELGTRALTTANLDDVLQLAVERVSGVLEADSVSILERLDEPETFRVAAGTGWASKHVNRHVTASENTQAAQSYQRGHSIVVDDFDDDDRFDHSKEFDSTGFRSGISTSVGGDASRWGVIGAQAFEPGQFVAEDVLFLENVAAVIGAAAERNQLKNALSEVLGRIDEAVVAFDTDWSLTYVNAEAERLLREPAGDLFGRKMWDLTPDSGGFRQEFTEAMQTQETKEFEAFSENSETWYNIKAYPSETGLSVYFTDITERHERETEIEQYGLMLKGVADAVYALDTEGRFTAVNPAFERLTGLERDAVLGSSASLLVDSLGATDSGDAFAATGSQTVEFELNVSGDETVRVENHRTPLVIGDEEIGSVGVLRDVTQRHRYERLLAILHKRTREMMSATDRETVFADAVAACDEVLGDARTELFVFDESQTALTRVGEAGTGLGDKPIANGLTEGGVWDAFVSGEVSVVEIAPDGGLVKGVERVIAAPIGRYGVLVTGHPGTVAPTEVDVKLVNLLVATVEELLERIDAESELRERDRRLAEQNEVLTRLDEVNKTIRSINKSLIRAPTHSDALSAVGKLLAESDPYSVVWHVDPDEFDGGFSPTPGEVHGADPAYIDRIGEVAGSEPMSSLLEAAIASQSMQVVEDVLNDPAWADHRGDALTYGFRSIAVIPAVADNRVEALFVVHVANATVLADEGGLISELGDTVGYALATTKRAGAMLTERKTRIQVQLGDDRLSLARLARSVDHSVELTGVIPKSDGSVIAFIITDAEPDAVLEAGCDVATGARLLSEDESGNLFELRLPRESLFETLYASEGVLRELHSVGDQTTLTVDVPERVRVRSFVDTLDSDYPGTNLLSRRTLTDGAEAPKTFQWKMRDAWTDRQYEAIRAAYFAGFFEWPRRSTAEALAGTFDISAPTYQYHLRAAERKLVESVFD
ncbi:MULTISPECIES: bacterio-opsin activator domain-containing protein [Haloferax]|uniref:PAS domain-containing protein n=1 Tax=Haloferax marinum TaxID=2666143 RepID=A0A6A8G769_9EURY|nr:MULTISPECIES: bacterio-opsin activator domain-containing protein [Haloferax]KAB1198956.1 PAS domain-containing protein [Haloferax sp. CBA1150]MRW97130.1 PAS domain-containing protein [Haloferax marinum]